MGIKKYVFGKREAEKEFVSTWKTDNISTGSSAENQIKLPLQNGGVYNFIVDWGDGTQDTITSWNQAQVTHTYSSVGTYKITIVGICYNWTFYGSGDKLKILNILSWGNLRLGNDGNHFKDCAKLDLSKVNDVLDTTGLTNMGATFYQCTNLTTINRINEWDVSNVSNMAYIFYGATYFNQNIEDWNVSKVTKMNSMFGFASSFNQNIGGWNVSNVSNFVQMFYAAIAFNNGESPDINNWTFNTVSDINMSQMFSVATSFNQNIGSWNISKVTEVRSLFHQASNFNNGGSPDINNWNTSSCVNMSYMFADAKQFNQNIGNWNISKVTNFSNMFSGEVNFDNGGSSDINNWVLNSASDIDMSYMFAGGGGDTIQRFNQPIGNWNTSKVTNMSYMFSRSGNGINLFNQDIGNWNVSNVTNMAAMFYKATNFNQNIGNWDVSKVINMASMFGDAPTFNNGESSDINNWKLVPLPICRGHFMGQQILINQLEIGMFQMLFI